jgi:type VI secretion system protein ImpL
MKSFLLFLAKAALLVLLALFSWAVALYIGWEWWAGTMIFLAIIAVYLSFKLARRLWITVRSRVKLAQSEHALRQGGGDTRVLSDITAKWKRAIQLLRKSSLKRFGNPLHVLPWYMVVGESGAGKTTAITRSRLASVVKNVSQADPIIQTSNFEWWFFSKAIVIDTAGRYVSPSALDSDQGYCASGLISSFVCLISASPSMSWSRSVTWYMGLVSGQKRCQRTRSNKQWVS